MNKDTDSPVMPDWMRELWRTASPHQRTLLMNKVLEVWREGDPKSAEQIRKLVMTTGYLRKKSK